MFKKYLSVLLILCFLNIFTLPIFAKNDNESSNSIIDAEFKTELNVNKASKGEVVQFVSTKDYNIEGVKIPKGTIFQGEVKAFKKGRWGYRRAKAFVKINKMILPNGETLKIKAFTKKHVLKGPAMANVSKGFITFPIALVVGVAGVVVVIVEAISIAGIILIGPTTYGLGRALGGLTHGINCKKEQGDDIELQIKSIRNYPSRVQYEADDEVLNDF